MGSAKSTRTLELKLSEGPSIYAHAEMDDTTWARFLELYCIQVGDKYYLNGLVTTKGLLNTSPISVVTTFNRLQDNRYMRWRVFKRDFVNYHWKRSS